MTVYYLFQAIILTEKSVSINNIVCFKQRGLGLTVLSQMTSPFTSPRGKVSVSDASMVKDYMSPVENSVSDDNASLP